MKKTIQVSMFIALIVLGIGMINTSLSGVADYCLCFNEAQAWTICEGLCSNFNHGYCIQTVETNSWCNGGNCDFNYWGYCQDGYRYRRTVGMSCEMCQPM